MPLPSKHKQIHIPDNAYLHDTVVKPAAKYGDNITMIDGERQITYAQFCDHVHRATAALHKLGVQQDDVVFLFSVNCYDNMVAFLALSTLGAIMTTVSPLSTPEELTFYLSSSKPSRLIAHVLVADTILQTASNLPELNLKENITIGEKAGYQNFVDLYTKCSDPVPARITTDPRQQVAAILYSSGTTGMPKGVMITHYHLVTSIYTILALNNWMRTMEGGVRFYSPLPMYHVTGLIPPLITAAMGGLVIFSPHFEITEFLTSIQKYKINFGLLVPPLAVLLAKHPIVDQFDLSSLKHVLIGAAPLGVELEIALVNRLKLESVKQVYGMTEFGPFAFVHGELPGTSKQGTVGMISPNNQAMVVDIETGKELGPHTPGEVWLRGPPTMKGYLGNPAATQDTFSQDGWYKTGDIATYDDEGFLTIVDRLKELIKYKAFQVAPAELEDLLMTHPAVGDAAVIGLPDEEAGELPKAFVKLQPGKSATQEDIQQYVAGKVAPHKRLRGGVVFIDEIPKSPSGKILRRILKDKLRQEAAAKAKL